VVVITCGEDGVSPLSPAQVALFRVYACIAEGSAAASSGGSGGGTHNDPPAPFRLLVPSQQIGCLLG